MKYARNIELYVDARILFQPEVVRRLLLGSWRGCWPENEGLSPQGQCPPEQAQSDRPHHIWGRLEFHGARDTAENRVGMQAGMEVHQDHLPVNSFVCWCYSFRWLSCDVIFVWRLLYFCSDAFPALELHNTEVRLLPLHWTDRGSKKWDPNDWNQAILERGSSHSESSTLSKEADSGFDSGYISMWPFQVYMYRCH